MACSGLGTAAHGMDLPGTLGIKQTLQGGNDQQRPYAHDAAARAVRHEQLILSTR